jgi:putative N6-adenine-specific DNA methylase
LWDFDSKSSILITCAKELPYFVKRELAGLGFPAVSESIAGVETCGTLADTMLLNLKLRTGSRILYRIAQFPAAGPPGLYDGVKKIKWEEILSPDEYLTVESSVQNPNIRDERFVNLKAKDAIVDRMALKLGRRPDSGPERKGAAVFIYWVGDACMVYIDSSGESLQKRGYRKIPFRAPLQETLAAALVMASKWDCRSNFINPMCGSGTIAVEAALYALNRAPGLLRSGFGFMRIKGFPEGQWRDLRAKTRQESLRTLPAKIIATDISRQAVSAALKNARTAGVDHLIDFGVCDFRDTPLPDGGGVIVMNPEYGERMGEKARLEDTYKGIGDYFKQKGRGYTGYVFTGNPELAKKVGLRTSRKLKFFNSSIECRLLEYELYEGSRKGNTSEPSCKAGKDDER